MTTNRIEKLAEEVSAAAAAMGLPHDAVIECLKEATQSMVNTGYSDDETKGGEDDVTLSEQEAADAIRKQEALDAIRNLNLQSEDEDKDEDEDDYDDDDFEDMSGDGSGGSSSDDSDYRFGRGFGKKIVSKATESVRQIAKKKGIYIVGRKGKKFLGIRFTKKGNYSKNKKGRPNGKMYTYDGLKKMKNKRVSFKKLPELIDMMNTKAVLKKYKNFKFGFELRKNRCSGFGYTFPVGAGYGKRSALLYSKL